MTLVDQVEKLINIRIRRLERINEQLVESTYQENNMMRIYLENEAKLAELYLVLDFIIERKKSNEA